jgi:hypothetical protein
MKHIAIAVSVFSVVILTSCGQNEGSGARIEAAKPTLPALSTPPAANTPSPFPATGNMPAAPIIAASAKLNPAHGQPGHRCDIAVGAALPATGSAPGLTLPTPNAPVINTPVQTTAPTAPTIQPAATAAVAPGMNPAHGKPGHRCDIPVGQPLNSKPQASQPAVSTTPSPVVSTPTTSPVKSDGNLAKGLNPAHGQPGHRCDIAVGQPLKGGAKKDSLTN